MATIIDVSDNTKVAPSNPGEFYWDGTKWIPLGAESPRFMILTPRLIGERPDFFRATLTISSYMENAGGVFTVFDAGLGYPWQSSFYPYIGSLSVGQHTIGIDIFYGGQNNHLGDIEQIGLWADMTKVASIDAMWFEGVFADIDEGGEGGAPTQVWTSFIGSIETITE